MKIVLYRARGFYGKGKEKKELSQNNRSQKQKLLKRLSKAYARLIYSDKLNQASLPPDKQNDINLLNVFAPVIPAPLRTIGEVYKAFSSKQNNQNLSKPISANTNTKQKSETENDADNKDNIDFFKPKKFAKAFRRIIIAEIDNRLVKYNGKEYPFPRNGNTRFYLMKLLHTTR